MDAPADVKVAKEPAATGAGTTAVRIAAQPAAPPAVAHVAIIVRETAKATAWVDVSHHARAGARNLV